MHMYAYVCICMHMYAYVCICCTHAYQIKTSPRTFVYNRLFTSIEGSERGRVQIHIHDENMALDFICWFDLFVLAFIFSLHFYFNNPHGLLRPPSFCIKLPLRTEKLLPPTKQWQQLAMAKNMQVKLGETWPFERSQVL